MLNRNILLVCLVSTLLIAFLNTCMCQSGYTFNATYGQPVNQKTRSQTDVSISFLTWGVSGSFVYTDMSRSKEFNTYQLPNALNGYKFFGVFNLDMQNVKIQSFFDYYFEFKHDYTFGILNVNPKQMSLVGLDTDAKKVVQLDVNQDGNFIQKVVLPLKNKVYMLGIMGFESEIPAKFGVPTLVNYRASLKYDLHSSLNQYLSVFENRELTFPPHEYTTELVNNQIQLPTNWVEIVSFSVNPMLKQFADGNIVLNDFQLTFNTSAGFIDKNGKSVNIDFNTLKCMYLVDFNQGFISYASAVFPVLQQLRCSPGIGVDNFFPKYVTIVGSLKSNSPDDQDIKPLYPVKSDAKSSNSRSLSIWLMLVTGLILITN